MLAVDIDRVSHQYPLRKKSDTPRTVLSDVSFSIQTGETFGLLGPNGGGKTTLFKILSTLIKPMSGTARIGGADVVKNPGDARRKLGVVFQHPSLDKKLTVGENLMHHGHLYGLKGAALKARIAEVTAPLQLGERMNDFVETLSGGYQRRVEIAKGLLHRPEVLIMDEPSTGLDPGARRELWTYLASLKSQGITILVTTHLMEEGDKCDRLAILHKGKLVALGSPAELKQKIGGDVINIQAREPQALANAMREKFGGEPSVMEGAVRIERRDGHNFIPQLVEAFPGVIESVRVGKPTLEDVFARETGQEFFWQNGESHE